MVAGWERVRLAAHWGLHFVGLVDRPVDMSQPEGLWHRIYPRTPYFGMKWVEGPKTYVGKVWRRRVGDRWEYKGEQPTAQEISDWELDSPP